ncbi:hypothetical protein [Roseococcus pinisoli]|uniref:Uncharacterized protein n=1 Tax=Roseococcus pinisoli TaxID=2835040 RepID=A0ABS5QF86_9PROT|nr:hypothetical protein [Roseococcus pinisoli]MBS7811218.1 hypothetical protein [Roseococcus pinisoli]
MWSYSFHRFIDRAAYEAAIAALGWGRGAPTHRVALDVVGAIYTDGAVVGEDPDIGEDIQEQIPVPGWHVNAAWRGIEMPPVFADARVYPETPTREFAGVAP